jgi:tetratricopeptide (TPR) repeat protein
VNHAHSFDHNCAPPETGEAGLSGRCPTTRPSASTFGLAVWPPPKSAAAACSSAIPAMPRLHLLGLGALLRKDYDASVTSGICGGQSRSGTMCPSTTAISARRCARRADYREAHVNLGACLFALGQFEAAGEHFARALTLRPDEPPPVITTNSGGVVAPGPSLRNRCATADAF